MSMKSLKTILAGALLMFSASVMAQATYTDAENNKYAFQKHWFLNLQGGAIALLHGVPTWLGGDSNC